MTWNFAKKLPTIGMHHKALPDPEPTQRPITRPT